MSTKEIEYITKYVKEAFEDHEAKILKAVHQAINDLVEDTDQNNNFVIDLMKRTKEILKEE
jgi:hypothetical protein